MLCGCEKYISPAAEELNGSTDLHPALWDRLLWAFRSLVADFEKKTTRANIKEKQGLDLFLYCAALADRSLADFQLPQHWACPNGTY